MRIKSLLPLLASLPFYSVHAGQMGSNTLSDHIILSLSLGPGWYTAARTQTIVLQPGFANTYVAQQNRHDLMSGELFFGGARQLTSHIWGQLGIAGALSSPARLSGVIWETGDPTLNNFTYAYQVNHTQLSLKGKLLTLVGDRWYPYVSASVGAGFNSSMDYTSSPLIFQSIPTAPFTEGCITSVAYTVGAGIEKAVSAHWHLGVGYEFSDWGKSQLGSIDGLSTSNAPGLSHLYVNQLMFTITYLT